MARTIDQIFKDKLERVAADAVLAPLLTSTSKVAVWRLLLYISSVCDFALEKLQDLFRTEVAETIAAMKPHSPRWYALKAKAFQFGKALVAEADYYDNTGLSDSEIEESQIVKYSAVVEQDIDPTHYGVRIKVATTLADDLAPLSAEQLAAFTEYMQQVKDAGVRLLITSGNPDDLKATIKAYYDPLVLNNQGQRLDGTDNEPLQKAIKQHLINLPFNGRFNLTKFVDAMQAVDGVSDPRLLTAQARYGARDFTDINDEYIPDAGYLRIAADPDSLTIQWLPKVD